MECYKIVEFVKASREERKQYYTEEWDMNNVPNFILTTLKDREFGFDHNGNGPRDRYNGFNSPDDLKNFLQKRCPFATYTSVSLYENPKKRKNWIKAELVFDIDAKDLPVKNCDCKAREVCESCLGDSKELLMLTADVLKGDLGLKKINFIYSGRGYHIRVLDEGIMQENSVVRGEILDYVSGSVLPEGIQWKWNNGFPLIFKKRAIKFMKMLSEEKIIEIKNINGTKASKVKEKMGQIIEEFENGDLSTLKKILKNKGTESFLENLRIYNASILDGKVTIDVKRILRLPSSLHSAVSMKCMEVKKIEKFNPLKDAVPKFVKERNI